MDKQLASIKQEALEKISAADSLETLEEVRLEFFGRKEGKLNQILKGLKSLSIEQKKTVGPLANQIRTDLEEGLSKQNYYLERSLLNLAQDWLDVTLPGKQQVGLGRMHPISQIRYELEDLLGSMGFMVLDGPELESDYYNFEAVNTPNNHPARDMQDTFWVSGGNLMRTQTTAIQVRSLEKYGAPLRAIIPGRCFRQEDVDACHEHTFYQMEGMMVGKGITIANLIAVMKELLNGIFKKEVKVRLRPGYFPFVEPAFELDINCLICGGKGCGSCKHSGWLELLPCGMIHPNVLKYGGVDPEKYTGFAFAVGLDRLVMMRYGINDIRYFHENDIRFLKQF